ncbi:HTH_Tnp_Tc3_2 domain-containing protein [Trichonephila clavipes]|nr:HTH_Tnp_Tc3_2 domain-containing protein [Trichonephila clavipes]
MNVLQSLENLALIKVAISIYHSSEFSELKEKFRNPNGSLDILQLKKLFHETISNSVIPFRIREKLLCIITPIMYNIDRWNVEQKQFGIRKQLDICLTSAGTIDKIKAYKKFVRSDDENVVERFALACYCWMTDDVLKIWNKASVDEKIHIERKLLHRKDSSYWMLGKWRRRTEELFERLETTQCLKKWFDWLRDGGDPCTQHNFIDESLFTFSLTIPEPNLLRALPPEELRQTIKYKYYCDNGRDYFSCLDYDLKLRFFRQEPTTILYDYLKWPLQFKFLEMASQAWEYMTGSDFYELLWVISKQKMSPRIHSLQFESDFDYEAQGPRVTTLFEDRFLAVTAKRNRRSTASDLSRQLSSVTGTTVSRQTVYRRLGHIGLHARRPVRCFHLPQLTVACD